MLCRWLLRKWIGTHPWKSKWFLQFDKLFWQWNWSSKMETLWMLNSHVGFLSVFVIHPCELSYLLCGLLCKWQLRRWLRINPWKSRERILIDFLFLSLALIPIWSCGKKLDNMSTHGWLLCCQHGKTPIANIFLGIKEKQFWIGLLAHSDAS